jgi:hypothetical protein
VEEAQAEEGAGVVGARSRRKNRLGLAQRDRLSLHLPMRTRPRPRSPHHGEEGEEVTDTIAITLMICALGFFMLRRIWRRP